MAENQHVDTVVLGAGAAGLFCAAQVGQRGKSVVVIDHSTKPAEKVRISGGGRCNFTNLHTSPKAFLSQNPHFATSALARYTVEDFLQLLRRHQITWHEKTLGQLFCDGKSDQIIRMLLDEVHAGSGTLRLSTSVSDVSVVDGGFRLDTSGGSVTCRHLVIATGGLSIPKIGATGFAYDLARRFGHRIVPTRPALVPLTFSSPLLDVFAGMAGVSLPCIAAAGGGTFSENLLFTHRGLSGPAVLQISSYWTEGEAVTFDLLHGVGGSAAITALRETHGAKHLRNALETLYPKRFVDAAKSLGMFDDRKVAEISGRHLNGVAARLSKWTIKPAGTEGYRTAEVTLGGVCTDDLSSQTMESARLPRLYFIGEAVDVTGWLGGYNFQWAWASAYAAATAIAAA